MRARWGAAGEASALGAKGGAGSRCLDRLSLHAVSVRSWQSSQTSHRRRGKLRELQAGPPGSGDGEVASPARGRLSPRVGLREEVSGERRFPGARERGFGFPGWEERKERGWVWSGEGGAVSSLPREMDSLTGELQRRQRGHALTLQSPQIRAGSLGRSLKVI